MRSLRRIATVAAVGLGTIAIVLIVATRSLFPDVPDCGADSPAARKVSELSGDGLALLYGDVTTLGERHPGEIKMWFWFDPYFQELPASIRSLEPSSVSLGYSPSITLEGCFDQFVVLVFHGVPGFPDKAPDPAIELVAGGGQRRVIWQGSAAAQQGAAADTS